ncbi:MAG: hypothetical protein H5U02_08960 [Clostridia bacterium]|nr:hypothetical protein [Clostridia bacterium]
MEWIKAGSPQNREQVLGQTKSETDLAAKPGGFSLQFWKQYGIDRIGGVNSAPVEAAGTVMPRGPALSKVCRKGYNIKVNGENVVLYRNEGGITVANVFPRRPSGQEERMLAFRRLAAEMVIRAVKH